MYGNGFHHRNGGFLKNGFAVSRVRTVGTRSPDYSCSDGVNWFSGNGQWQGKDYEPKAGDIIFFDWSKNGQDGDADHVGIVEKCENGIVYTVEGNSGDACRQNSYPVGYYEILGYGCPSY